MVKTLSPETLARMDPTSRQKYEDLPDEVEEDTAPERNGVCSSIDEALATPAAGGSRYHEELIVGTGLKFRFRSLLTDEWLSVQNSQKNILEVSICDGSNRCYLDAEGVDELKQRFDARSYAHMMEVANQHCFCGLTLEGMREEAAKNLPATDTTATN